MGNVFRMENFKVFFLLLVYYVLFIAPFLPPTMLPTIAQSSPRSILLYNIVGIVILLVAINRVYHLKWSEYGLGNREIKNAVILFAILFVSMNVVNGLLSLMRGNFTINSLYTTNSIDAILLPMLIAITGRRLFEEIVCRGFVISYLRKYTTGYAVPIAVSVIASAIPCIQMMLISREMLDVCRVFMTNQLFFLVLYLVTKNLLYTTSIRVLNSYEFSIVNDGFRGFLNVGLVISSILLAVFYYRKEIKKLWLTGRTATM